MNEAGWGRHAITRRGVVVTGGVVAATLVVETNGTARRLFTPLVPTALPWGLVRVERIRRASDLLVANLVIGRLTYERSGTSGFLRAGSEPGYLGLVLPGQSLGENVPEEDPAPPVVGELALPTVLGFSVPAGARVPYSLDYLLDLAGKPPVYGAVDSGLGTTIEAPYRLEIRPHDALTWLNDTAPKVLTIARERSTELWHTRLASYNIFGDGEPDHRSKLSKFVRVTKNLATTTISPPLSGGPLGDRAKILSNANTFDTVTGSTGKVVKAPVSADLVLLSSLGASLDLHGRWPGANLTAWDHRATLGRDNYVRTVHAGWIVPYRHPATVIKETYRLMRKRAGVPATTEAILVKTLTLIIGDPVANTSLLEWRSAGTPTKGAPFPFTEVRCAQITTSGLVGDDTITSTGGVPRTRVHGSDSPLRLPFVGTDHNGNEIPFTSAVWFEPAANPVIPIRGVPRWTKWNQELTPVRTATVPNLATAVAPEHVDHPGLTTLPLVGMVLGVEPIEGLLPPWRPVASVEANLPGISALAGAPGEPVAHAYDSSYLANENNDGGVVLRRFAGAEADAPSIDPKNSGGLVPMPAYQGMSSKVGAVMAHSSAALTELVTGPPDIASIFGDLKLIGTLTLKQIIPNLIDELGDTVDDALAAIPGVTHESRDGRMFIDMDLTFPLQFFRLGPLAFQPGGEPLRLKAHAEAGAGGPAETSVDARLRKAAIEFAGIIALPIVEMRAQWQSGAQPVFTFEIDNTRFLGPLAFLQPLSDFVALGSADSSSAPTEGTSKAYSDRTGTLVAAPSIERAGGAAEGVDAFIDDVGLHLVADFSVPDVAVGVFTLSGLNFGVGVDLPFGGGLEVHAFFASFTNPFTLTFGGFGGTGFVDIVIGEGGLKRATASLGVAATVGVDLVVASGSLSVNVGVVLILDESESGLALQAFFRISGSISIPLIATVSVVFELVLEFRPGVGGAPSKLTGTATFLIKVDTLIFDEEVEARVSRTFKGGPSLPRLGEDEDPFAPSSAGPRAVTAGADRTLAGDEETPTFRTTHPDASTWQAYAAAFAKDVA